MKLEKIITIFMAVFLSYIAYAETRNLSQDQKMADLDVLIAKQTMILKHQAEINELKFYPVYSHSDNIF